MPTGPIDHELIIGCPTQREIVEAAGRHAISAIESAHVGPTQWRVLGNHGFNFIVPQNKVASDTICFFALWQFLLSAKSRFKNLCTPGRGHVKTEKNEELFHGLDQ